MKIIAYGVRHDEVEYMTRWQEETGHEVEQHAEFLTPETVAWAAGFDAVNCLQTTPYEAAVFDRLKEMGIQFLALRNVGTDNVDWPAVARNNVRISNVPAYSPGAIAEFSLTMTLNLLRRVGEVERSLYGDDYRAATTYIGRELGQSTVGVIGAGRIGQAAIRMFEGFGATVLAYDPYPAANPPVPINYVDLATLYAKSDIIDLHIPGVPENDHLIDAAAFDQMKPGAIVINTARGNLIETKALIANLKAGKIAGAGIDTFENETPALLSLAETGHFTDPLWDELLTMPNVMLTPHIAYYTDTAVHNMVYYSLQSLVDFLTTGETATEVTGH